MSYELFRRARGPGVSIHDLRNLQAGIEVRVERETSSSDAAVRPDDGA